jgi:hypothetical protein
MSGSGYPEGALGIALVYDPETFSHVVNIPDSAHVFYRPDVHYVVVGGGSTWTVFEATGLADRITQDESTEVYVDSLMTSVEIQLRDWRPDFERRQLFRLDGTSSLFATFVLSGIQIPGVDPEFPDDLPYVCNDAEQHHLRRPAGSGGSTCGKLRSDGSSCPGILSPD